MELGSGGQPETTAAAQRAYEDLVTRCTALAAAGLQTWPSNAESGTPMVFCTVTPVSSRLFLVWPDRPQLLVRELHDDPLLTHALTRFMGAGTTQLAAHDPERHRRATEKVDAREAAVVVTVTLAEPPVAAAQLQPLPSGPPELLFALAGGKKATAH